MKKGVFPIILVCILLAACSSIYGPVKELDALIAAKDEVLSNWAKTFDSNPTEAGVDSAAKFFESKKADLIAKRNALTSAPEGMNRDWYTKWLDSNLSDRKILDAMDIKLGVSNPAAGDKFDKLRADFETAAGLK